MKKILIFMFLASLSSSVIFAATTSIENPQGEVLIRKAGATEDSWTLLSRSTSLESGDSIKTQNGSCELVYSDQANIHLQANSMVTIQEEPQNQNIELKIGKLKMKVDKEKVVKPFQVLTPTAIATIRGTEVIFELTEAGLFMIDLSTGEIFAFNDEAGMELLLSMGKKISIDFDPETGELTITNDPASEGPVEFKVGGETYIVNPGESKTVNTKDNDIPETMEGNTPDTSAETVPDEQAEEKTEEPASTRDDNEGGNNNTQYPPL